MEKKTVLIIDDALFMRQVLAEILEKHGLHVIGSAADGEAGVAMYADLQPDLVILDIGLPGIDGVEVLRRIRSMNSTADIIMCSAKGQIRTILKCIEEGAGDFIVKPFQQEALLDALYGENKRQYESETIASFLANDRMNTLSDSLSQSTIHDLLRLCTERHQTSDAEILEFWSHVR